MWEKVSNAFYLYNTARLTKTILLCLIFAYLFNAQKGVNHCFLLKNFSYLCRKIAIKQLFAIFESQTKKIARVCILKDYCLSVLCCVCVCRCLLKQTVKVWTIRDCRKHLLVRRKKTRYGAAQKCVLTNSTLSLPIQRNTTL